MDNALGTKHFTHIGIIQFNHSKLEDRYSNYLHFVEWEAETHGV